MKRNKLHHILCARNRTGSQILLKVTNDLSTSWTLFLGNFVFNWHIFIVILIQQWEGYSSYTWSRSSSRIFTRTGKTWRHQGKYRPRIKKNGDKPLTNLTRSFLFPNVKDNSQNRKKIEKAFCCNVSVLFYTIFSLTCKQCRFTKGR